MNIVKGIAVLAIGSLLMLSCTGNKKKMIIGRWQGVSMTNPQMDSFFKATQKYIDTFGKHTSEADNIKLYGTNNLDSLRNAMQAQRDSAKHLQEGAILQTVFEFRKDSLVLMSFNGGSEKNSKWFFENDSTVVLEQLLESGLLDRQKGVIMKLDKDQLQLKFKDGNDYSLVTFKKLLPEKEEVNELPAKKEKAGE